jgi:hypothetical protein
VKLSLGNTLGNIVQNSRDAAMTLTGSMMLQLRPNASASS